MTDKFRSITLGGTTPFAGKWYRADDVDAYLADGDVERHVTNEEVAAKMASALQRVKGSAE